MPTPNLTRHDIGARADQMYQNDLRYYASRYFPAIKGAYRMPRGRLVPLVQSEYARWLASLPAVEHAEALRARPTPRAAVPRRVLTRSEVRARVNTLSLPDLKWYLRHVFEQPDAYHLTKSRVIDRILRLSSDWLRMIHSPVDPALIPDDEHAPDYHVGIPTWEPETLAVPTHYVHVEFTYFRPDHRDIDGTYWPAEEYTYNHRGPIAISARELEVLPHVLGVAQAMLPDLFENPLRVVIIVNWGQRVDANKRIYPVSVEGPIRGTLHSCRPIDPAAPRELARVSWADDDAPLISSRFVETATYDTITGAWLNPAKPEWFVPQRCVATAIISCFGERFTSLAISRRQSDLKREYDSKHDAMRAGGSEEREAYIKKRMLTWTAPIMTYDSLHSAVCEEIRRWNDEAVSTGDKKTLKLHNNSVALPASFSRIINLPAPSDYEWSIEQVHPWLVTNRKHLRLYAHRDEDSNFITAIIGSCRFGNKDTSTFETLYAIVSNGHMYQCTRDIGSLKELIKKKNEESKAPTCFSIFNRLSKTAHTPTFKTPVLVRISDDKQRLIRTDNQRDIQSGVALPDDSFYVVQTQAELMDALNLLYARATIIPHIVACSAGNPTGLEWRYQIGDKQFQIRLCTISPDQLNPANRPDPLQFITLYKKYIAPVLCSRFMSTMSSDLRETLSSYIRPGLSRMFTFGGMPSDASRLFKVDQCKAYPSALAQLDTIPLFYSYDHLRATPSDASVDNVITSCEHTIYAVRVIPITSFEIRSMLKQFITVLEILLETSVVLIRTSTLRFIRDLCVRLGVDVNSIIQIIATCTPSSSCPNEFKNAALSLADDKIMPENAKKSALVMMCGMLQKRKNSIIASELFNNEQEAKRFHARVWPLKLECGTTLWAGSNSTSVDLTRTWLPIGHALLDQARLNVAITALDLIDQGATIRSIHTDELSFWMPTQQLPTVNTAPPAIGHHLSKQFGCTRRLDCASYAAMDVNVTVIKPCIPIIPPPVLRMPAFTLSGDERNMDEARAIFETSKRSLFIRAQIQGAGKTFTATHLFPREKTMVVMPTNATMQDWMKAGFLSCTATQVLGGVADIKGVTTAVKDRTRKIPANVKLIIFDEIGQLDPRSWDRMLSFVQRHTAPEVKPEKRYAFAFTGDVAWQLNPIGGAIQAPFITRANHASKQLDIEDHINAILSEICGGCLTLHIIKRIVDVAKIDAMLKCMLVLKRDVPFTPELMLEACNAGGIPVHRGLPTTISPLEIETSKAHYITATRHTRDDLIRRTVGVSSIYVSRQYGQVIHREAPKADAKSANSLAGRRIVDIKSNTEWRLMRAWDASANDPTSQPLTDDETMDSYVELRMVGYEDKLSINPNIVYHVVINRIDFNAMFIPAIARTAHSVQGATLNGTVHLFPCAWMSSDTQSGVSVSAANMHTGKLFTRRWFISAIGRSSDFDVHVWIN